MNEKLNADGIEVHFEQHAHKSISSGAANGCFE
jgi:hypothetical protein